MDDCSSDDSDMSSSSGTSCSSEGGSPAQSARGDDSHGDAAAARPRLFPSLLLCNLEALPRGDGPDDFPGTARQQSSRAILQPAMPAQPDREQQRHEEPPASSRGLPAQHATALPLPTQQPQPATPTVLLSFDVLSPAFSLQQQEEDGDQLGQRCASRLGVPQDRLKYYALTEVASPEQLPAGCSRAAVQVLDSRFCLSGLEELLAENQRLGAAQQEQQQQGEQSAAEVQQLQMLLRSMQMDNEALRRDLRNSEGLRRKGQKVLHELKQDFDVLSRDLMRGWGAALEYGGQQQRDRAKTMGTPVAIADALL